MQITNVLSLHAHVNGKRSRFWKGYAHVNGKRSRFWKGTLTLLERYAHAFGKVRSRFWKGTLTLLERYAHVNGKTVC